MSFLFSYIVCIQTHVKSIEVIILFALTIQDF